MAARRRRPRPDRGANELNTSTSVPAQEDEADILDEVDAERDEGGELLVDEANVRSVGAVDAASVRDNRRLDTVVKKKRGGVKDVPFNTGDVLVMYDTLIRVWPPNTLDISVRRLTGQPVQNMILSRPRSGAELYEALKSVHGQLGEAEYEVRFLDNNHKQFRGTGRITMPDTRGQQAQQQGQPMQHQPPGYPPQQQPYMAPAPGYSPAPQYAAQHPQQQQQPAPQAAAPMPVASQVPFDPMTMMGQLFDLFQRMQATVQPPQQPQQPQQQYPQYVAPQAPVAAPPPMPPPGATPEQVMTWMKQMFELYRGMLPPPAQSAASVQAQPQMMGAPPAPVPPGMMYVPNIGYVEVARLMRALAPEGHEPQQQSPYRPPYGRPQYGRPPYGSQQGDPQQGQQPYPPYQPQHQQQQQRSPVDSFRESLGTVRAAADMLREVGDLLPGYQGGGAPEIPEVEEDDSPVRVIDTGPAKIVVNKEDGTLRLWETGFANADKAFKWIGEQAEAIRKTQEARADREERHRQPPPQRRALPPGYVEVTEGYRPPPGFVAVPVDQPPPVQQQPQYPQQQQQHAAPPPQQPSGLAPPPQFVPPQVGNTSGGGKLWG